MRKAIDARFNNNSGKSRRMTMKTILSALVTLVVLAGVAAAPASANDWNSNGRNASQFSPL
jgi:hypothetical protein